MRIPTMHMYIYIPFLHRSSSSDAVSNCERSFSTSAWESIVIRIIRFIKKKIKKYNLDVIC